MGANSLVGKRGKRDIFLVCSLSCEGLVILEILLGSRSSGLQACIEGIDVSLKIRTVGVSRRLFIDARPQSLGIC